MTCIVEYNDERHIERELTPDLINALNREESRRSGDWQNYVLSLYVNKNDNKIHLYFDGPWEC